MELSIRGSGTAGTQQEQTEKIIVVPGLAILVLMSCAQGPVGTGLFAALHIIGFKIWLVAIFYDHLSKHEVHFPIMQTSQNFPITYFTQQGLLSLCINCIIYKTSFYQNIYFHLSMCTSEEVNVPKRFFLFSTFLESLKSDLDIRKVQ